MTTSEFEAPLGHVLKMAECGQLVDGWLYLPPGAISASTRTLFLASSADEDDPEAYAAQRGYPREGLDAVTLVDIVQWTKSKLTPNPTDEQLLRSFDYYWRFDAFPPALGAADPPSGKAVLDELDRQFYESLGTERPNTNCQHSNCERGTVWLSVFCRRHHFESVRGRPWKSDG